MQVLKHQSHASPSTRPTNTSRLPQTKPSDSRMTFSDEPRAGNTTLRRFLQSSLSSMASGRSALALVSLANLVCRSLRMACRLPMVCQVYSEHVTGLLSPGMPRHFPNFQQTNMQNLPQNQFQPNRHNPSSDSNNKRKLPDFGQQMGMPQNQGQMQMPMQNQQFQPNQGQRSMQNQSDNSAAIAGMAKYMIDQLDKTEQERMRHQALQGMPPQVRQTITARGMTRSRSTTGKGPRRFYNRVHKTACK